MNRDIYVPVSLSARQVACKGEFKSALKASGDDGGRRGQH